MSRGWAQGVDTLCAARQGGGVNTPLEGPKSRHPQRGAEKCNRKNALSTNLYNPFGDLAQLRPGGLTVPMYDNNDFPYPNENVPGKNFKIKTQKDHLQMKENWSLVICSHIIKKF